MKLISRLFWLLFNKRQREIVETWFKHLQQKQTDRNTTI